MQYHPSFTFRMTYPPKGFAGAVEPKLPGVGAAAGAPKDPNGLAAGCCCCVGGAPNPAKLMVVVWRCRDEEGEGEAKREVEA